MTDPGFTHRGTDRLLLDAVGPDDTDALHVLTGAATDLSVTAGWIARAQEFWRVDGLSYWLARSRADRAVLGIGGVQQHRPSVWNLYYRLDPTARGQGYATELGREAIACAHRADPRATVIARIDSANRASVGVAVRLKLELVDRRPAPVGGGDTLTYADGAWSPQEWPDESADPGAPSPGSSPSRG